MFVTHRLGVLVALGLLLGSGVSTPQDSGLAQRAREQDIRLRITSAYPPANFDMLVGESDAIVIGTVTLGRTFLAGETIQTNYDVTVDRVIRGKPSSGVTRGDVLVIRRAGGATTVEGHTVIGEEEDFPQFSVGNMYVFFLKRAEQGTHFWPAYGPQGVFRLDESRVRQVSEAFGSWNRERGNNVPLETFVREVQQWIEPPQ
jgi:hypothetical protein